MSQSIYQQPGPARYYWHTAVGTTRDVRQDDPRGRSTPAASKNRPAIGFIAGNAGLLVYIDSGGYVQVISALVSVYYAADIQQLVQTANVVPAETGTNQSVTSTAFKLTLFWEP